MNPFKTKKERKPKKLKSKKWADDKSKGKMTSLAKRTFGI